MSKLSQALERHFPRLHATLRRKPADAAVTDAPIPETAVNSDLIPAGTRSSDVQPLHALHLDSFRPLTNSPIAIERLQSLVRLMRPRRALRTAKVRLGGPYDGGYVCLDDFKSVSTALSFGTGTDVAWDIAMGDKGIVVHQFDHTVAASPVAHVNFRFYRRRIAATTAGENCSIESAVSRSGSPKPLSVILKIDIEGDEWPVFGATSPETLMTFSQVICEFHHFDRIADADWYGQALAVLGKLNDKFAVVHVHGNNCGALLGVGNVRFPDNLEVSYASRAKYEFAETDEVFPGALDAPNEPMLPDYDLGRFVY